MFLAPEFSGFLVSDYDNANCHTKILDWTNYQVGEPSGKDSVKIR